MASLVLGVAGAVVGSFVGGPLGASIGWSLGAALGGALFQKGQQGPKLTDLKLQNSSYGAMIPILYGIDRFAGQIMWQTDLHEHEHKSGGKGGPEITNYTYTASFAVLLCDCSRGPIGGVRRIWADSRLVWQEGVSEADDFPFTLYLGTSSQLPDPTIESFEGAGNVPGYRYRAYAVFNEIDLGPYNNRIPSLTWEVFSAGGNIPFRVSTFTPFSHVSIGGPSGGQPTGISSDGSTIRMTRRTAGAGDITVAVETRTYDYDGNELSTASGSVPTIDDWNNVRAVCCANNSHIWAQVMQGAGTEEVSRWYTDGSAGAHPIRTTPLGLNSYNSLEQAPVWMAGNVYALSQSGGNWYVSRWPAPDDIPSANSDAYYSLGALGGVQVEISVDEGGNNIWVVASGTAAGLSGLWRFDDELNLLHHWDGAADVPSCFGTTGLTNAHRMLTSGDVICMYSEVTSVTGFTNAYVAFRVESDFTFTKLDTPLNGATPGPIVSLGGGFGLVSNPTTHTYDGIICINPPPQYARLGDIVRDICYRCGMTAAQVMEQLDDLVPGYLLTNQADGRNNIEPLQAAWPFDAVEHDVVLRFPRRGVDGVVFEIPDEDLGAHVYGEEPPAIMVTEREQEIALPKQISTVFINLDADYQNGTQIAQRQVTNSQLTTTITFPIVMSDAKAREATETILYNGWTERERFKVQLPRNWLLLEPADVGIADDRLMRLTKVMHGADGVLKLESVAESLQLYMQATVAAPGVGMPGTGGTPPTTPPSVQGTDLLLLDIPLVRDIDAPNGFYAAMAGAERRSWAGATLFRSIDGGVSYSALVTDTTPDTFGTCSTVLGDFAGGNTFDEGNTLTVVLSPGAGTLESSNELGVLNGANLAAVGSGADIEIIQFRDAILTGTNTYELSGLLRGRKGTEWMIGAHVADESFCLLPTSANPASTFDELGAEFLYKAVTSGRALSTASPVPFTNNGAALRPYSPSHLGGGRNAGGDIILNWTPRERIPGGDALDFTVRVYTDNTYSSVVTTIGSLSTTATYTAANQTIDFGSPQATIYWDVRQNGLYESGPPTRAST